MKKIFFLRSDRMNIGVRLRKKLKLLPFLVYRKDGHEEEDGLLMEDLEWLLSNECVDVFVKPSSQLENTYEDGSPSKVRHYTTLDAM